MARALTGFGRLVVAGMIVAGLAVGLGLAALLGLFGGGRERAGASAATVATATDPYRARLAELARDEEAALAALAAVTGEHYQSDEALGAALDGQVVPKYRALVAGLKALAPPGERKAWHERLHALAAAELAALEQLAVAVKAGDGNAVLAVNREQRRLAGEIDALLAEWGGGTGK